MNSLSKKGGDPRELVEKHKPKSTFKRILDVLFSKHPWWMRRDIEVLLKHAHELTPEEMFEFLRGKSINKEGVHLRPLGKMTLSNSVLRWETDIASVLPFIKTAIDIQGNALHAPIYLPIPQADEWQFWLEYDHAPILNARSHIELHLVMNKKFKWFE